MKNYLRLDFEDYENIINGIYCSVLIVNCDGELLFYNKAAMKLYHSTHLSFSMLMERLGKVVDVAHGQGRFSVENGDHWVICNIYPWQNETARKGSILVLHESGHATCSAQELDILVSTLKEIENIIESIEDAVIVADAEGRIIRVNQALERTFGVKRISLIGRLSAEVVQEGIFKEGIVNKVLASQKKIVVSSTYRGKALIYTGVPGFNDLGKLTSVVVTIQDVTAINDMRHRLSHQEKMMADYVREIATMKSKNVDAAGCVVSSKEMEQVMEIAQIVAKVDSTVLITGESGTGKEKVVDVIYEASPRKDKPFIKINCGAIPDTLFESELFGYMPGSFTGAGKNGKIGFFELANTGTLVLDEVGELSQVAQVKLLRAIQDKKIIRIGSTKPVDVDVRIIAATNRNLWQMVTEGTFRQDLYYRLNVISIDVPPLRQRRDDIIPLARHFVDQFNQKYKKNKRLSMELCQHFMEMEWLGNIREMENIIEAMVVLAPGNLLLPEHIPIKDVAQAEQQVVEIHDIVPLKAAVALVERQLISLALRKYKTTGRVAQALGVNQSTISRKMKALDTDSCNNA